MVFRWARALVALALPLFALDCSLLSLDELSGGDTSMTSASTGGSSGGGSGGDGATGAVGGAASTGGKGGAGGHPVDLRTDLFSEDLLVRCYLDEAERGLAPDAALDYAPHPLDLPFQVGPLTYATVVGNRGLSWPAAELAGGPKSVVEGTKLESIGGLTKATLEAVVNVTDASVFNSRIIHMGSSNDSGRLTLNVVAPIRPNPMLVGVALRQEGWRVDEVVTRFAVDLPNLGRVVLHAVVDLDQPNEFDRVQLFLDGVAVPRFDAKPTTMSLPISLGEVDQNLVFMMGNRFIGDRSFAGTLFYGAVYTRALGEDQVQQNASALLAGDDSTPP